MRHGVTRLSAALRKERRTDGTRWEVRKRRGKEQIVYVVFKLFRHLKESTSAPCPGDGRETNRG